MAAGANKLVLEVTSGKGAFMKDKNSAEKLSKIMKNLGKLSNIETVCVITNMDQPIGKNIRKLFRSRRSSKCIKWKNGKGCTRNCINSFSIHNETCRTWRKYRRKQGKSK